MNMEDVLTFPIRAAIMKSILSRGDTSTRAQINKDVAVSRPDLHYHLQILVKNGVLVEEVHPELNKINGQSVYMYRVSAENETLQNVLKEYFPESFT